MRASTLKRFIRLPRFAEHMELHRLDCASSHGRAGFVRIRQPHISRDPGQADSAASTANRRDY